MLVAAALQARVRAQVDWSTAWLPQFRVIPGMAYDTARNRLVVFGGGGNSQALGDTWEWDGADWMQAFPSVSPPARGAPTMTYDVARGVVVMFGGQGPSGAFLTDTWEWDGTTWTERFSASQPQQCFGLTYDAGRSRVVATCRSFFPTFAGEIWEWDGVSWTLRHARPQFVFSPPAYDAPRQICVLTGFDQFFPQQTLATYLWDGASLTPVGAPPDAMGIMVEDPAHGYVLGMANDTWAWNGSQWSKAATGAVGAGRSVVYDHNRQRPIAMGAGTTLEWDGANWVTLLPFPSPPSLGVPGQGLVPGPNLAYDSIRGRIVYAGQGTWEWNGGNWVQRFPTVEPPVLIHTATAFSSALGRVVLFGGTSFPGLSPMNQTWLWDGVSWTLASPASSPAARSNHALAYDSSRDRVVLFGGYPGSGALGDTWEFDGATWTQQFPPSSPAARNGNGLAYDSGRRLTVLFGGSSSQGFLQDTWEWDGITWQQRFPATLPPKRAWPGMTFDQGRGRVVLFGGRGSSSTDFNDTWEWDGIDWTQRTTPNAPPPRYDVGMAYDSARREVICYGGVGSTQDTWQYAPTDPAMYITSQSGCPGSAGTPTLTVTSPSGYPWLGDPFAVLVTNAAPGSAVAMAAGFSSTVWAGVSLPLPLAFVGMPGCAAYCSGEFFFPVGTANPSGNATWTLGAIPNDSAFLGARFFTQAWIVDSVNPAGLVVSDLGEAVVGGK